MRITRLIPAILLLLLLGCQSDETSKGPMVFGSLYVRYLQDGQLLKAEASFFEGDSASVAVPISILGGVSFQGSGMEQRNIQDKLIRYQYENKVDYPEQFTFQVQTAEGESHQFQLKMLPVSQFFLPDTLSLGEELTVEIQPAPRAEDEELVILLTDATGKASLLEIPPPIAGQNTIAAERLLQLTSGNYQVYLVKKQVGFINEGVYRISCEVEYYTELVDLRIER